ncbi:MAG TPA: tripartite tricarboxylate transporter substrate binding protein [Eoetvoesiella sp.]
MKPFTSITHRLISCILVSTGLIGSSFAFAAQSYPERPIRLVVPSAPGGSPDLISRLIAPKLSEILGQSVVVENQSGAAGIIGTQYVAHAKPDGYTLLYGFNQVATMNPPLYPKLSYNPEKDLAPIGLTLNLSYVWIAPPEFKAKTMKELVAMSKADPGSVNYASTGYGSAAHLGGILVEKQADIKMLHVPYKGNTTADLLANVVQLKLDPVAAAIGLIKSGRVHALAVSSPKRSPQLPNVPTVAETLPGYEVVGWQGMWAPAGTPEPIITKLNAAMVKVIKMPEIQKRIEDLGYEPLGTTPKVMADRIKKETAEWTKVIKDANIKLD